MFETLLVETLVCVACGKDFQGMVIHGVPDDVCSTACMIDLAYWRAAREAAASNARELLASNSQGKFCTVRNKPSNFPP